MRMGIPRLVQEASLFPVATLTLGLLATSGSVARADAPSPFTEEAVARGLVYPVAPWPHGFGHQGYGVALADMNNDGHLDVIALGKSDRSVGVFENDGTGHFTDRSALASLGSYLNPSDLVVFDYNNDGLLDILVIQLIAPNRLFRNDGNFAFTLVDQASLEDGGDSQGGTAADFDGDGWLDVYIANYSGIKGGQATSGIRNKLYKNLGNGQWQDVSIQQGVDDPGYGFFGQWCDVNRDAWPDLYLSNDRGHLPPFNAKNRLWENQNGQLIDISAGSGADIGIFSMGVAMGDLTQNGYPDFYATNISGYAQGYNFLLLNQGPDENGKVTFIESSLDWGVRVNQTGWGAAFLDLTNNGKPDLYVNNMFSANSLFLNDGVLPLVDTAAAMGVPGRVGTSSGHASFAMAYGDVNNDGALDMLLTDLGGNILLYLNNEGIKRNFVRLQIIDHPVQRPAANASVDATHTNEDDAPFTQHQHQQYGGNNYLGQNELWCHFGIGHTSQVDSAIVTWQGGVTRTLTNIPAGTRALIYHPDRLGDLNNDGIVDPTDLHAFAAAYAIGTPEPGTEMMDFNGDFIINNEDLDTFLARYTGPVGSCPATGVSHPIAIIVDGAADDDMNGIPDLCQPNPCACDLDGSLMVDTKDLGILLGAYGNSDTGDVNADGITGMDDLAALLSAFGQPCLP